MFGVPLGTFRLLLTRPDPVLATKPTALQYKFYKRDADLQLPWVITSRSTDNVSLNKSDKHFERIVLEGSNLDKVLLAQVISDEEVSSDVESIILSQSAERLTILIGASGDAVPDKDYKLYVVTDDGQFDAGVGVTVSE